MLGRGSRVLLAVLSVFGLPATAEEMTVATCDRMFETDGPRSIRAYNCLGIAGKQAADPGPVLARLEAMVAAAPGDPLPLMALGNAVQFRDAARAEALFGEALAVAVGGGDREIEGWARWRLATCYGVTRRLDEADREYALASEIGREIGSAELSANVVIEHARLVGLQRSELSRARLMLSRLEGDPIFGSLPERVRMQCLHVATLVAVRLNLSLEAWTLAQRMVEIAESGGDPVGLEQGLVFSAQAWVLGDVPGVSRDEARQLALRALDLARARGQIPGLCEALWPLAGLSEPEESWAYLDELEQLTRQSPWVRHMHGLVHGAVGRQLLRETPPRVEEAAHRFRLALDEALEHGTLQDIATAFADLAAAQLELGDREAGLRAALRTMETVERLENMQDDDLLAAGVLAGRSGIYYVVAEHLMEAGSEDDLALAVAATERMRARRLARQVGLGRSGAGVAEMRAEARKAAERLDDDGAASTAREELSRGPSLDAIASGLGADEALLVYLLPPIDGARGWLVSVSAAGARSFRLSEVREIDTALRFWLSMVEQRTSDETIAAAALYRLLLESAADALPPGVRRLTVVPDGMLHRAPLDALIDDGGKRVVSRYDLSVAPSIAFRLQAAGPAKRRRATAVVLADPDPPPEETLPAAWREGERAAGRLPFAAREGAEVFRRLGRDGELRLGAEATETYFKHAAAGAPDVIHFAAHAVIDEDRPQRSAIVLSPDSGAEDGLLHGGEIAALDLDGALVVLSGCTGAGGRFYAGEGVFGLARSFLQAGARSVVGGLWAVRDREAAELMSAFYEELSEGRSVAAALAAAKRRIETTGAPPSAWASFVVLGSGATSVHPAGPRTGPILSIALGLAALVGVVLLVARSMRLRRQPR